MNSCPQCGSGRVSVAQEIDPQNANRLRNLCEHCGYQWFTKTLNDDNFEEIILK